MCSAGYARWRRFVQTGLMPVTAGWSAASVTVVATLLLLFTRVHPLVVPGTAAAPGAVDLPA